MNNGKLDVAEIVGRIRARVQARQPDRSGMRPVATAVRNRQPSRGTSAPAYDLSELHVNLAACNALHDAVGVVNPRRPGLHNEAIQLLKKMMRRTLTWYTRPLHQFHAAVTRTLNESTRALEDLRSAVADLQAGLEDTRRNLGSAVADLQAGLEDTRRNLGSAVADLQAGLEDTRRNLVAETQRHVEELTKRMEAMRSEIPERWLAIMDSHVGPKAAAHLWFNDPIAVRYNLDGKAVWSGTTERIIEKAWVLRHLAPEQPGARILDLGCTESTLALELASNGFHVTGIDVRDYPLQHPNLQFLRADICKAPLASDFYDVVIALSTVEHLGLGAYGDPRGEASDLVALREAYRVLKPGGRLLITVPFGRSAVTPLHRIYDRESVAALLADFTVMKIEFGVKDDGKTWLSPVAEGKAATQAHDLSTGSPGGVAMAVCQKTTR